MGLGLAAIGRPAYITSGRDRDLPGPRSRDELRARAHELLDHAYAIGIRYADAARSYGDAEQFLGSWLDARGVDDVFVASKWGYSYVGEWRTDAPQHEVKSHDLATFERQLAETRALLGDRLRLYQVHSVTPDSPLLTDRPLLDRLTALRDSGVELGVSTSGPNQAEAIERVAGPGLFTSVQSTWNLMEVSAGPALAAAHDAGWRVVVKEGVANGRLAVDVPAPLAAVATRHGVTPDAVALSAATAQPWCDVILSGAVTPAQLSANASRVELDDQDRDDLSVLVEKPDAYWRTRSERPWA
ncbi:MAG TPA: aldo/keto reductase [Mycobacteriales bacterium]|jgi:aryl-alcohol dehydrogenase-like predicted oxidoreductase|nr:aldo/keto reductase [Mycobacteriales bacterium]